MTFGQKVPKLNSRLVCCSRLYCIRKVIRKCVIPAHTIFFWNVFNISTHSMLEILQTSTHCNLIVCWPFAFYVDVRISRFINLVTVICLRDPFFFRSMLYLSIYPFVINESQASWFLCLFLSFFMDWTVFNISELCIIYLLLSIFVNGIF